MLCLFAKKKKAGASNRRRFVRVTESNAMLIIDGVSYGVIDWSLDGFQVAGYRGGLDSGSEARGRLVIVYSGAPQGLDMKIRILREDAEAGEIAGQFVDMSAVTRRNLELIYNERVKTMRKIERRREAEG